MEMTNIHKGAIEEIYKCASINLSPNTMGQVTDIKETCLCSTYKLACYHYLLIFLQHVMLETEVILHDVRMTCSTQVYL
jgi:hypothetical protein